MSRLMRQFHRWVSALFVVTVIVTTIAMAQEEPVMWIAYTPLAPLALLALTGIYLFALPYAAKGRRRRASEEG
jgi:heme/copper-type cytochrome/quinol oxidase subunit 1